MRISIFVLFLAVFLSAFASDPESFPLYDEGTDGTPHPDVGPHRRMPPAPVMCLIDFEEASISGESPVLATVTDYQLWDADGSVCITASPLAADVLTYAAASPGETFILRLVTPTLTLRGYISAD